MRKRKAIVLGAGIKGSAIASLLSLTGKLEVALVSPSKIGAGATSTNHGRLHAGTAGWRTETDSLILRRGRGSQLMQRLLDLGNCAWGHYFIERDEDVILFTSRCEKLGIPARLLGSSRSEHQWIDCRKFSAVVEVPEFSFNPARLAGRFARVVTRAGGQVLLGRCARSVEWTGSRAAVVMQDGSAVEADIVINAGGRWCNSVTVTGAPPLFDVEWSRWRLLCLQAKDLLPLQRVISVIDEKRKAPSAIPHGQWVTIDCKTEVEKVGSPDMQSSAEWQPIDLNHPLDRDLYGTGCEYFKPLRSLRRSSIPGRLFTVAGVQGRIKGAPPGSINRIATTDACPGYFVAFGGQASTAVLDACDVIDRLADEGECLSGSEDLLALLTKNLPMEASADSVGMVWEQREVTGSPAYEAA